jgi:peptidoglycan/xylan/chitin deacetylase (PgdA/CDA1 family)
MLSPFIAHVLGKAAGFGSGAVPWRGIRVLAYHGLVEDKVDSRLERNLHLVEQFRSQVRFLRRRCVLGTDDLLEIEATGRFPKRTATVITFDDGYVNNLIAAEILDKHQLPWTLFVSTGTLGIGGTIWTVELSLLLLHGEANRIELNGQLWPLRTRQDREHSFQSIRTWLKRQPAPERRELMNAIRSQFPAGETARLLDRFPGLRILSWEQLGQLALSGVTIGSHGVEHELHHASQPESVRLRELVESKATLEEGLRRSCRFFAFPNGDHDADSASQVRQAGYDLAFTTEPGTVNGPEAFPLLPRLGIKGSLRSVVRDFYWSPSPMRNALDEI